MLRYDFDRGRNETKGEHALPNGLAVSGKRRYRSSCAHLHTLQAAKVAYASWYLSGRFERNGEGELCA